MIKIEHLRKNFKEKKVLKDVNAEFEEGKVYALIAPNGTGKSTFISILAGFMLADEGKITFENGFKKEDISVILSGERNLYMKNSVYENLMYLCILKGMTANEANTIINNKRQCFPFYESLKNKLAETLSYGQKRLVALMSAIVTGAKCIIIDEATEGLDMDNKKVLEDTISEMSLGRVVLVVTHDLEFSSQVADFILFLKDGNFVSILPNSTECEIRKVYKNLYKREVIELC